MSTGKKMELDIDGTLISCLFHKGGENAIVFIHGFGSSKEVFGEAFENEKLHFTMLSTDLIGFGESDKPPGFSYRMREQASVLKKVIECLGVKRFHIVAHSMGGIVGIELAEMMPNQISSLIDLDGNLTIEDCTMSKQVAEMSETYFAQKGFENLRNSIAEESRKAGNESLKDYLKSLVKPRQSHCTKAPFQHYMTQATAICLHVSRTSRSTSATSTARRTKESIPQKRC